MSARDRWLAGCLVVATTIIAGCGRQRTILDPASRERDRTGAGEIGERENEGPEDDYFYAQRRLPDGRINLLARTRAMTHARFLRARRIAFTGLDNWLGANESWVQVWPKSVLRKRAGGLWTLA